VQHLPPVLLQEGGRFPQVLIKAGADLENRFKGESASVRRGGLLIYQTFTRDQLRFSKGSRNPAHLLSLASFWTRLVTGT
jgi:hypothetical protein